tara:strand:- start:1781 stop:2170 length:390 start_codon:yes stop_codon:yes gene_type:complete
MANQNTNSIFSNQEIKKSNLKADLVEFLDAVGQERIELNANEYEATKAFFIDRDYDKASAETTAYILMVQAKKDNADIMSVLDTLRPATPVVISQLVTEILNAYRYKTSVLGYKNDKTTLVNVSRNIQA